jgi:hypothetical protein
MIRVQVLTVWVGSGVSTEDARRPKLGDDYPLRAWQDVTGQPAANLPPDPPLYLVEVVCADAVFAELQAAPDYADGILWHAARGDGAMAGEEFGRLRTFLQSRGVTTTQLGAAVGGSVAGRTRREVAETLAEWLRHRPPGGVP